MKNVIIASLCSIVFFGALFSQSIPTPLGENSKVSKHVRGQAISVIFDTIELDESKNEKLMAFNVFFGGSISSLSRPAYILAWFKFADCDECINVDYYAFPRFNKFSEMCPESTPFPGRIPLNIDNVRNRHDFQNLMVGINKTKKLTNILKDNNPKQLHMPLPKHLQGNGLFDDIQQIEKKIDYENYLLDDVDYFWGFKSNKEAYIHASPSYVDPISERVHETIDLIVDNIQDFETPEEWKLEAEKLHKKIQEKLDKERGEMESRQAAEAIKNKP